ncbi:MAG: peptide deformylase [Algisphaera sp.]
MSTFSLSRTRSRIPSRSVVSGSVCPHDATACLHTQGQSVRQYPDPLLTRRALPVAGVHAEMPHFAALLIRMMQKHGRHALAAPQLGIDGRVVVVELEDEPMCLVNPQLEPLSRRITVIETCVSRPGVQAVARRYRRVRVTGWDHRSTPQRFDLDGPAALALQHAVDHLDGRVICAGLPALRTGDR